jgi:hypothetical protein
LEGIGALGRVVCAAIIFFAMNLPPLTKDEKAGRYLVLAAILFIGGFIFGPPIGALALACIICVFVRDTA